VSARPLFEKGTFSGVLSAFTGITALKQAEEALRESDERFRILFDYAPDGYYLSDLTGNFVDGNKAAEALVGYNKEELIGKNFLKLKLLPLNQIPRAAAALAKNVLGQPAGPEEFVLNRKDGTQVAVEIRTHPVQIKGRTLVLGIARDITERKRATQMQAAVYKISEAVHSVENLQELYRVIHGVVGELMPAQNFYIALYDAKSRTLSFPYFVDEHDSPPGPRVLGTGVTEYVLRTGEALLASPRTLEGLASRGEIELIGTLPATWLGVPLKIRGEAIGVLVVQSYTEGTSYGEQERDILIYVSNQVALAIERKRAEEALRQYAAELEARNEELDAFAHTVAHDLKGPVSNLVSFAGLLAGDYAAMPDEIRRESHQWIVKSAQRMSNIIDALLLLASVRKVEEVEVQPLDMASIVADTQERLAYLIEDHQAQILMPDTWPVALGNGPWVEEVWVNYLSNAIQYGGRPPRVELGAEAQAGGMVRFWVRDNGHGIPPQEQANLFTPFTRLDQVRAKGHGLGLSIVRRIVEKLGGQVGVESSVGKGSTFFFTLPAPETESSA